MTLNTYLIFDGDCREAFEFYRSVFGGEYEVFTTFGDVPDHAGRRRQSGADHACRPAGWRQRADGE